MTPLPEAKVGTGNHRVVSEHSENPLAELVLDKKIETCLRLLTGSQLWLDTHKKVANIGYVCMCCDVPAGAQISLPMTHLILNP